MKNIIRGKIFVLGHDIDTDQIIPAQYLSYNPSIAEEKKFFGKYALCGVPAAQSGLPQGNTPFVKDGFKSEYTIVVAGKNFGCGSSREHAPLALKEAGIEVVVANSFARIYYRNCVNGGYVIPYECSEALYKFFKTGDEAEINVKENRIINVTQKTSYELQSLGGVLDIIQAGDIFEYAKKKGK